MRRALVILLVAGVAVLIAVVSLGKDSSRYEVGAVFDTARGLVPGQLVKISGARVGEIKTLDLLRGDDGGYKALVTLDVPRRFEFREDATCKILPEGLISENYVECDPGRKGTLADGSSGIPTVPVKNTSASVSLQDVLNVFSVPTPERLRLFVDTLGLGTAGRGEDINEIIRRANPALTEANRVFRIVADQNSELATAVGQTDQVLAELATHEDDVRAFVGRAADVATTTADHRTALSAGVRGLPAMLDAVKNGLRSIDRVTTAAPPLLANLRAAAPALERLNVVTPQFARVALPGLASLSEAARTGLRAIGPARTFASHARLFARRGRPAMESLETLLLDVRDTGGVEGLLDFFYNFAAFTAPYDAESHTPGLLIGVAGDCQAVNTIGAAKPGCQHNYSAPELGRMPINAPDVDPGPMSAETFRTGASLSHRKGTALTPEQSKALLEFILK
jgi:phospholipid/cholesterol/gamma-HCH transport system substrate-binding protein